MPLSVARSLANVREVDIRGLGLIDLTDLDLALYTPLWHQGQRGDTFNSMDPNRHLCSVTGALWTSRGRDFDGVDDKISVPHHTAIDITTGDFSVGAWVDLETVGAVAQVILWKSLNEAPWTGYYLYFSATDGYFMGGLDPGLATDVAITDSIRHAGTGYQFYFMTVDRDNATGMKLFFNGEEVASGDPTTASDSLANTNSLYLGVLRDGSSNPFDGLIGEVWIYRRALTLLEIQRNYLATRRTYIDIPRTLAVVR